MFVGRLVVVSIFKWNQRMSSNEEIDAHHVYYDVRCSTSTHSQKNLFIPSWSVFSWIVSAMVRFATYYLYIYSESLFIFDLVRFSVQWGCTMTHLRDRRRLATKKKPGRQISHPFMVYILYNLRRLHYIHRRVKTGGYWNMSPKREISKQKSHTYHSIVVVVVWIIICLVMHRHVCSVCNFKWNSAVQELRAKFISR